MATLTAALNTTFVPAVGDFIVQSSGGSASLWRRNTTGAAWVACGQLVPDAAAIVSNPIAGAEYQFTALSASVVVQADQ